MLRGGDAQRWRGDENDAMNARGSALPLEEQRVGTSVRSFEELLARELAKSQQDAGSTNPPPSATRSEGVRKKPFLKKGDRGWWMERPGAKAKVVKHVLTSKDIDGVESISSKATTYAASASQRSSTQHSSSRRNAPRAPLERLQSRATDSIDHHHQQQRRQRVEPLRQPAEPFAAIARQAPPPLERRTSPPPHPTSLRQFGSSDALRQSIEQQPPARLSDSMRTTTSVDTLGMSRVRQSYEAQLEREADELADFEAIERELAAEKDAYLLEKREYALLHDSTDASLEHDASAWHSAAAPSLASQRRRTSLDDNDLELNGHSSLLFSEADDDVSDGDDHFESRSSSSAFAAPDPRRVSDQFARRHYAASELSAISLNDSESWTDHASPQMRRSSDISTVAQSRGSAASRLLSAAPNDSPRGYGSFRNNSAGRTQQQQPRASDAFSDDSYGGYESGSSRNNSEREDERESPNEPPVSQLMRQFFGDTQYSASDAGERADDREQLDASHGSNVYRDPGDDNNGIHERSSRRPGSSQAALNRRTTARLAKPKAVASSQQRQQRTTGKPTAKPKSAASAATAANKTSSTKPRGVGPILPVVVEEKLFELAEEVKFYKAETLQLQRKKEACDQAAKKLAAEREDFARWQHEQRALLAQEWAAERLKMKREEKLVERQLKLKLSAAASQHDRKERGEIDALKAQIVTMQLDEKARASKWKAMNDNLRQRVTELEEKNRELSDEIKFLEKERLEQWGKYEALRKDKQRPTEPSASAATTTTRLGSAHFDLDAERDLRTVNDLFAIKDTADELLRGWRDRRSGSEDSKDDCNNAVDAVAERSQPVGTSDKGDVTTATAPVTASESKKVAFADNSCHAKPTHSDASKQIERDVVHPGGKREIVYSDGSRKIHFADGNEKEIDAHGHTTIRFTNGDRKETTLTTYPDKTKVYEFPNQQVEKSYPDGTTEISFADGITKTIRPNGDEFSVFPDGTTMLEQKDGLREVTLLNDKKIRYYPDGAMAWITPQGAETPVHSDAELKKLMEGL